MDREGEKLGNGLMEVIAERSDTHIIKVILQQVPKHRL
jgi:hypothetical protein